MYTYIASHERNMQLKPHVQYLLRRCVVALTPRWEPHKLQEPPTLHCTLLQTSSEASPWALQAAHNTRPILLASYQLHV
jgi:hypothetical protein